LALPPRLPPALPEICQIGVSLGRLARMSNRLFYGDNLEVLRGRDADGRPVMPDESVDLVYLDPPFNSAANYNVLFRAPDGKASDSQLEAFEDTWHWGDSAEAAYNDVLTQVTHTDAATLLRGIVTALGRNDMTAYLVMMAVRLMELHRVLKPTGSLYLHCDPTASHYLKIVLDGIFGPENFRNEISWKRSNPKSNTSINLANCRDIIFRYSKNDKCVINKVFSEHDPEYVEKAYRHRDYDGRRFRYLPLLNPSDNRPNLTYEFLGVVRVWRWTRNCSPPIRSGFS